MSVAGTALAIRCVVAALRAAVPDPLEQIRALLPLTAAGGSGPTAVRARRAAAIGLGRAARDLQPRSSDEALRVLALVSAALGQQILVAGDAGDDRSYLALRALRSAVVADLAARGATLAPLAPVERPRPLPSLVLAQQLYGDPGRADELVQGAGDVPHPLFMPTGFQALAS